MGEWWGCGMWGGFYARTELRTKFKLIIIIYSMMNYKLVELQVYIIKCVVLYYIIIRSVLSAFCGNEWHFENYSK